MGLDSLASAACATGWTNLPKSFASGGLLSQLLGGSPILLFAPLPLSAAGAAPQILHVPSDAIVAGDPSELGSLFGDKIYSTVFDNSKLRGVVPGYRATVPFAQGIAETVAWFDADPDRRAIDEAANLRWDNLATIYQEALARAR
jgi:hypothetical protein